VFPDPAIHFFLHSSPFFDKKNFGGQKREEKGKVLYEVGRGAMALW
jgi:hypothetical protein